MKRLFCLAAVLIVTLCVLIFGAQLYGKAHPDQSELRALHLFEVCHGQPCVMGIVPGETDIKEAMKVLEPYIEPGYGYASIHEDESSVTVGFIDTQITDVSGHTNATLGAFVGKFGAPCGVSVYSQGSFTLYYEKTIVEIDPQNMGLNLSTVSPNWHISSIDLVDPTVTFTDISVQTGPCHITVGDEIDHADSVWLGFASLEHYYRYAQAHPRRR